MEWALVDGQRVKAEKSGAIGVCPGCGGEVRAKCGEVVSWHWAHINADCDPWSEPETDWHRKWKGYFPDTWQEVTKPPHRADVAGPNGVLEIQHSGITPEEIREREQFYGRMAWIIDGHDFWQRLDWHSVKGNYYVFRWKHAKKTWLASRRHILIDTPFGLFKVKHFCRGDWTMLAGSFVKAAGLVKSLDQSGKTSASNGLRLYDAKTEKRRNEFINKSETLFSLYDKYYKTSRAAWPQAMPPSLFAPFDERFPSRPVWSGWPNIYEWLLNGGLNRFDQIAQHYERQIQKAESEINRKELLMQKSQAQRQKANRLGNEKIARQMLAGGDR